MDWLNGDHSFKSWFKIMWKNFYIQLFILGIAFFVGVLCSEFDEAWHKLIMLAIPTLMMGAIGYLGFYKFWKELTKKK